jgi:AcrR family transcriptional regulator
MATIRLDADERRKAIVTAALPLFARNGFAGTTTREIAEAADISEALLFRHFPSKRQLYGEILRLGCEGDPALDRLATLAPSTATLVHMIHYMVRYFLMPGEADRGERDCRLRLVLHSFLEDGDYARELFDTIFTRVEPLFAASVAAASAAGDLRACAAAGANRFWFGHHVAAMIAFVFLPARACIAYAGSEADLVAEATRFILSGIGLTEAAIAAWLEPGTACSFDFDRAGDGGSDGR